MKLAALGRTLYDKANEIGSGKKLIVADYSQIELRVIAQRSGDQRMINVYQRG
ncbi:MAG: DNA polymerase [Syntrophobacteraceae bacterium]